MTKKIKNYFSNDLNSTEFKLIKSDKKKSVVVILGMHRSGTSLITRSMEVLNASFTDNLTPPVVGNNDKGFFEDKDILEFNEKLLSFCSKTWNSWSSITQQENERLREAGFLLEGVELMKSKFAKGSFFAIKDPRMCRLLPIWKMIFSHLDISPNFLIAIRNPLDIVRSLGRRDRISAEKAYYLWISHTLTCLRDTEGQLRSFVSYNSMLEDTESELTKIANQLDRSIDEHKLIEFRSEFISYSLRHSRAEMNDLLLDVNCPSLASEMFEVLNGLIQGDGLQQDLNLNSLVMNWGDELQRLSILFKIVDSLEFENKDLGQLLKAEESNSLSLSSSLLQSEAQVNTLNQEITRINQEWLTARNEITNREEQIAGLAHTVSEREAQVNTLNQEITRINQEWLTARNEITNREEQIAGLAHTVSEREAQVNTLNQEITRINQEWLTARNEITNREEQIAGLAHTVSEREAQVNTLNQEITRINQEWLTARNEITNREEQITGLNQYVGQLIAQIAERGFNISSLSTLVDNQLNEINKLEAAIFDLGFKKSILENSLEDAKGRLDCVAKVSYDREAQVNTLNQEITRINQEWLTARNEITNREEQIAGLAHTVNERNLKIDGLNQEISRINQEWFELREINLNLQNDLSLQTTRAKNMYAEIEEKNKIIGDIYNSNSWIYTKPLRCISSWLKNINFIIKK